MFVKFNGKLVNTDTIDTITFEDLSEHGFVHVHFKDGTMEPVEGLDASHLLLELNPAALEGLALKFERNAWTFHNLVAHPIMQILSWMGFLSLGLKIHDLTVPTPINKKQ